NYAVDPVLLKNYLPTGTHLELWNNQCYLSLVGFMFLETKFLGVKFPLHTNFPEVNLRFYVNRNTLQERKRGVVFIKEVVPLPVVTFIANTFYKEHYHTMPMRHSWKIAKEKISVEYAWKKNEWYSMKIVSNPASHPIVENSIYSFFTDNPWGFNRLSESRTLAYEVEHPVWKFYDTLDYSINVDFEKVYGPAFSFLNHQEPDSVFLIEGSEVTLEKGKEINLD
ncbi:MAG: DUF2071 domain-containing protein, partial [Saprospiraceae bacterium]